MNTKGFALVTMLMVVSVVGILTAGSLILSVTNLRLTRNDATASQATAVAQAGSAYWRAELVSLYMHMVNNFEDYEDDINAYNENNPNDPITCGNFFAIGVDLDRDGTPEVARGEALPTIDIPVGINTGKAVVSFDTRGSAIVLDARGNVNGARGRMVDEFNIAALDMWNNAVFAGDSAANATIKGRAEIRGSVHVLGEGLTSGDVALDLTGSFALGNTYRNLSSDLAKSIDPTGSTNPMRLTIKDPPDLCATLRVKRGYVDMGSMGAQIGFAEDKNPEPHLDNMRGIFVNEPIQGGELEQNVFSLNGMTAAYDAGNTFQFPYLDDNNPESDPAQTWREGLRKDALLLSTNTLEDDRSNYSNLGEVAANDGEIYLTTTCWDNPLFGNNNDGLKTTFKIEYGVTPSFHCAKRIKRTFSADETIVEVKWELAENRLTVVGNRGVINLRGGDLLVTGANNEDVVYKGEGIIFVEDALGASGGSGGNITLASNFLPAPGKAVLVDGGGGLLDSLSERDNTYPATTVLALVADKIVETTGSQRRYTAAIFAESEVKVSMQALLAGSIVTPSFNAGSQVPSVLYVPNLAERLSELLPGSSKKNFAVSNVSFSRR